MTLFVHAHSDHWYAAARSALRETGGTYLERAATGTTYIHAARADDSAAPNCLAEYVLDTLLYCAAATSSRSTIRYLPAPSFKSLEFLLAYFRNR